MSTKEELKKVLEENWGKLFPVLEEMGLSALHTRELKDLKSTKRSLIKELDECKGKHDWRTELKAEIQKYIKSNESLRRVPSNNYTATMLGYNQKCINIITKWLTMDDDTLDKTMKQHLCDTCMWETPCNTNVIYGLGVYSDNRIYCDNWRLEGEGND